MIYNNLEFHNISQLLDDPLRDGLFLKRFPEAVRTNSNINDRARFIMNRAVASEIRFVTDAPTVHLYLESHSEDPTSILIFRGDFLVTQHTLCRNDRERLVLTKPERFDIVRTDVLVKKRFSPDVWRIFFGNAEIIFKGIDTMGYEARPPERHEKPETTMLSYGSSITMGSGSSDFYSSYAVQTARILDSDLVNLGLGGACWIENEIVDFIAIRDDWDFAVFELGVNMRILFTKEQFRNRVSYLLDTISKRHPEKHLFLITVFPNYANVLVESDIESERDMEFSEVIRELVKKADSQRIHIIEGSDVLTDFSGLTADLIHPSDEGFHDMAHNLAEIIQREIT